MQRAKAFQIIQKNQNNIREKFATYLHKKVEGRIFHLLLLIEETINKIYSLTKIINCNHELYILIRGVLTKSKIVCENLIDVKKLYNVLT